MAVVEWSKNGRVVRSVELYGGLNWLLRNARHVQNILIAPTGPGRDYEAVLFANGERDGMRFFYRTRYNSVQVMGDWLSRNRNLRHVQVEDLTGRVASRVKWLNQGKGG